MKTVDYILLGTKSVLLSGIAQGLKREGYQVHTLTSRTFPQNSIWLFRKDFWPSHLCGYISSPKWDTSGSRETSVARKYVSSLISKMDSFSDPTFLIQISTPTKQTANVRLKLLDSPSFMGRVFLESCVKLALKNMK